MTSNKLISIIVAIGVVLAVAIIAMTGVNKTSDPMQVACTMEALMCPDGSSVGRGGPLCEFATCPHQASFTGMLAQTPDGQYYLHTKSVLPEAKEPYLMPLHIGAVNMDVSTLVGQQVVIQGVFTAGNNFSASSMIPAAMTEPVTNKPGTSTSGGSSGRVMTPGSTTLSPGKSGTVIGLTVTLNSVSNDSRCPVDVQCIQAGNVTTSLTLATESTRKTVLYKSGAQPMEFAGYLVSITDIQPVARARTSIKPADYRVTVHVESQLTHIVDNPTITALGAQCTSQGGKWDALHRECGGIDAPKCTSIGGVLNECGSACRHNPEAEMCTLQCVQFCQL